MEEKTKSAITLFVEKTRTELTKLVDIVEDDKDTEDEEVQGNVFLSIDAIGARLRKLESLNRIT